MLLIDSVKCSEQLVFIDLRSQMRSTTSIKASTVDRLLMNPSFNLKIHRFYLGKTSILNAGLFGKFFKILV